MNNGNGNGNHNTGPYGHDILSDVGPEGPVRVGEDERLWKLYVFRPASGRATRLEHRIYLKCKVDGRLEMVTFAVHAPEGGIAVRSGVAHVPDITAPTVAQIIATIRQKTAAGADEYLEVDLSNLSSLDEQLEVLKTI